MDVTKLDLPFKSLEFSSAFTEWVINRKVIKKPLTERAANKWIKWMIENQLTENEAINCLKASTLRDWVGLFLPTKFDNGNRVSGTTEPKSPKTGRTSGTYAFAEQAFKEYKQRTGGSDPI